MVMISELIAGTMLWGKWGKKYTKSQIANLISHCIELGITTFDHADIYGDHTTEFDFGQAATSLNVNRESYQIITKCGICMPCENTNHTVKHYNYSFDYIVKQCEKSLENLHTDYIDIFLLHRPSPLLNPHEVAKAISYLKEQGKIKSFGVSNFTSAQTEALLQIMPIEFNQIEFSLTHYMPMIDGSLNYTMQKGIKVLAWSPLGLIFNKSFTNIKLRQKLEKISNKYNTTTDVIAIQWIKQLPNGIIPVVGTTLPERISNISHNQNVKLTYEEWFVLWEASMGREVD